MKLLPRILYADDDTSSVKRLVRLRVPSLAVGLALGILLSFVTSRFEEVLASDIHVVFFIPFIVYMADAVGTQTQSIYVRDLRSGKASFKKYLVKEVLVGIALATAASLVAGLIVLFWLNSTTLACAVSLSMFLAVGSAPLVALLVAEALQLERTDPAVGAGPIATVIQDTLSVLIYGLVTSFILL